MKRCYFDGLPDSVPDGLLFSGRVPSYKALALCILNNDFTLRKLGFNGKSSEWAKYLKDEKEKQESQQMRLL